MWSMTVIGYNLTKIFFPAYEVTKLVNGVHVLLAGAN